MKKTVLTVWMLLLLAGTALAANLTWMPNFPMRMGAAGVMAMWMPVPGATEYKLLRQVGGGAWEQVYKGPMNNFQDPTAPTDKDVAYKVVAVVGGADGGESNPVTLKGEKPIEPPADLSGRFDPENKTLQLRWNRADGASFYNVYRAEAADQTGTLLGSVQDQKFHDSKVEDGRTYWYSVSSVSAASQESKRGEVFQVEVKIPKEVKVKKFDPVLRKMKLLSRSIGEDFANFKNPLDFDRVGDDFFVLCEDGVQVVNAEGVYVRRLALIQEKMAKGEWSRPTFISPTKKGTFFLGFISSGVLREFSGDGSRLLREIRLPKSPKSELPPDPLTVAEAPDGRLWVVDSAYGNITIIPGNADGDVKLEDVEYIGWLRGAPTPYDAKKDGVRFYGPMRIRWMEDFQRMAMAEGGNGRILFLDPKQKKVVSQVGGQGGTLDKFSNTGDYRPYDATSLLILDPLQVNVRRIKVSDDDTNGDYIESFVDDPAGKQLRLTEARNIAGMVWDQAKGRLYVLSALGSEVLIYKVE